MSSIVRTSWRLVAKRLISDRFVLSAAAVTILLASGLLAASPIYADAVSESSARRILLDADPSRSNVEVGARVRPDLVGSVDGIVGSEVERTFGNVGGRLERRMTSGSFELPDQVSGDIVDVTVLRSFENFERHARVDDGRWPANGAGAIETVVPGVVLDTFGLDVGDDVVLTDRVDATRTVTARIVGSFTVLDPSDPFWFEDELDINGSEPGQSFNRWGPFIVDRDALLDLDSTTGLDVDWRIFPNFSSIEVSDIEELRRDVATLRGRVSGRPQPASGLSYTVDTELGAILTGIEQSLTSTRSNVLIVSIQLAVLAGYALVLTAGLLADTRISETRLLTSRGASAGQIGVMAAMEALLISIPAVIVSPWLAARALTLMNVVGPLEEIGLELEPNTTVSSYALAALAAVACVGALAIPTVRRARRLGEDGISEPREDSTPWSQRGALDLALVGLAGIGYWQLRANGSQLSSNLDGTLGSDPLLVLAPALGLVAGAVLSLRIIPLCSRLAERVATRRAASVPALAAWQLARRPRRYARSGLLLVMSVAVGVIGAAYASTWDQVQDDQAAFRTGADVNTTADRRLAPTVPRMNVTDAFAAVEEIDASMAVARVSTQLARLGDFGRFLFVDAASAAEVVPVRSDQIEGSVDDLFAPLLAARPTIPTVTLPGEPTDLAIEMEIAVDPLDPDVIPEGQPPISYAYRPSVRVVLQDGSGRLHRIDLGSIDVDSGPVRLTSPLSSVVAGSPVVAQFPVGIVEIELSAPAPLGVERVATVDITRIEGRVGGDWTPASTPLEPDAWQLSLVELPNARSRPAIEFAEEQPASILRSSFTTGSTFSPVPPPTQFGIRPAGVVSADRFPVLVADSLLERTGTDVGDDVNFSSLRTEAVEGVIVGSLASFPTVDPTTGHAVVIDLPTFQMLNHTTGGRIQDVDEYWVAVDGGSGPDIAELLTGPDYRSTAATSADEVADSLKTDPIALGTIGSLAIGFAAATVFAAVGFSVSAAVSARERSTEFALLRAVGMSQRQLSRWLVLEHGALVVVSLVLGLILGLGLSVALLPLISINQDGTAAPLDVEVVLPWLSIVAVIAAVVFVLLLVVGVLAAALRRLGVGALLRLGDDT